MEMLATGGPRRVTREELYRLVWRTPMMRLAEEFGMSGRGLAKVCERLDVPCPPRGYWAKKDAGKPVVTLKLPPRKDGVPEAADIAPSLPKPEEPRGERAAAKVVKNLGELAIPVNLEDLHPRVQAWIKDHAKSQKERERESRRRHHYAWRKPTLLPDLTERDLYRFRATSAIFRGVESAGGQIESAPVTGKATFLIEGHKIECSIVEKMVRSLKQWDEQRKWTAFPDHYQSGLESSGYLRVSITTYIGGRRPEWIESDKISIGQLLTEIVGTIVAAGPVLEEAKRKQEERETRYREEEARRYKARRLKEIDDKRWNTFREFAGSWEERRKLSVFLAELEARFADEGDVTVSDRPLSEWIGWAKVKIEALDPLKYGTVAMFQVIAKVTQWS